MCIDISACHFCDLAHTTLLPLEMKSKEISQKYKSLDEDEMAKWKGKAGEAKEDYKKKLAVYEKSKPADEKKSEKKPSKKKPVKEKKEKKPEPKPASSDSEDSGSYASSSDSDSDESD